MVHAESPAWSWLARSCLQTPVVITDCVYDLPSASLSSGACDFVSSSRRARKGLDQAQYLRS